MLGDDDGEVRAERIERAVRQVDQPAQREDQRQAERDQQVVGTRKQAIENLLEDLRQHGFEARRGPVATERAANSRLSGHQVGIVQGFSSRVGAMISRLWLSAGTGGDRLNNCHLSLTCDSGLKVTVYICCMSW